MLTRAMPAIILSACAVAACSRASALWPHASVASVVGAASGKCPPKRRQEVEKVLRSLTLSDFSNWRAQCNCMPRTLRQALYQTQGGSTYPRNAIYVTLHSPIYAGTPNGSGNPDRRPISSLIVERYVGAYVKHTTVFFGRPKRPGLRIASAVAYDGWGLKGDPFDLARGECR